MTDQAANKPMIATKKIPINWVEPGLAMFANNVASQSDGKAIYLTFAQISPPFLIGKDEATVKQEFDKISSVSALPVVRLVIPVDDYRIIVRTLQAQLEQLDQLSKHD